jgi:Arc/MetJ-type ribon-helix-helix transcriptional regulator
MRKQHNKERASINIDKDSLDWIEKQIQKGEFDNRSSAIRKCIIITKRVFEQANPEEKIKFIHGE